MQDIRKMRQSFFPSSLAWRLQRDFILLRCREGIWVSLGFFEDIFVPEYNLQSPSQFESQDGVWVWTWDEHRLYMDEGSEVRLRVKDVKLNPVPTIKQLRAKGNALPLCRRKLCGMLSACATICNIVQAAQRYSSNVATNPLAALHAQSL